MFAKKIANPPISGSMAEIHVDLNSAPLWIHFEDQDYDDFCGVFGSGWGYYSGVSHVGTRAFVISGGQGYLFDIQERCVLHKTRCDYLVGVIEDSETGVFVARTETELLVYKDDLVWASNRIALDGIEFDKIQNGILFGSVCRGYHDVTGGDLAPFVLDLKTLSFQCDWVCAFD